MISKKNIVLVTALCLSPLTTFAAPLASTNGGHLYVDVGASAYYLNNPNLYVDTLGTSSHALGKINNSGFTPQANLKLGYQYQNNSNSWVTSIFGHTNAYELKFDYFNTNQTRSTTNPQNGMVYYIDGSGQIGPQTTYSITRQYLRAKDRLSDVGLYFRGHKTFQNSRISFEPFVGIVHNMLDTHYSSERNFVIGSTGEMDSVDIKTEVEQFGIALGNQFDFNCTPQTLLFLNVEAQLLHANASLDAQQDPILDPTPSYPGRKIHDSAVKKLTYRAKASLGITYKFTKKPDSISVTVAGGIDRMGYNPKVVMPNNADTRAVHLSNHAQNNFFGNVELHVPMG